MSTSLSAQRKPGRPRVAVLSPSRFARAPVRLPVHVVPSRLRPTPSPHWSNLNRNTVWGVHSPRDSDHAAALPGQGVRVCRVGKLPQVSRWTVMAQAKRLRAVEQNDSTEISTARARQTQARDGAANLGAMRQQPEAASELKSHHHWSSESGLASQTRVTKSDSDDGSCRRAAPGPSPLGRHRDRFTIRVAWPGPAKYHCQPSNQY